jgi:hypothetical protein
MDAICTEFQKNYASVNLDFQKKDAKGYDYMIILIYLEELKKGYKVKRINKTTKKGTTVIYSRIGSKEELEDYMKLLQDKIQEFNEKWDCDLQLEKE